MTNTIDYRADIYEVEHGRYQVRCQCGYQSFQFDHLTDAMSSRVRHEFMVHLRPLEGR